ncbi:hypothetical protein Vretimale_7809 [Volvox reticuliferus]|uniref:Uncharacterized protein n=1 Tax=Volvox reticuliferus TaxID=1737510 RepID=A0A8J4GAD1_9CHLO|nr:hypothetical protein Vretifemale_4978 [Volvox reticuliferus]GIM03002.1 hypothetical protein Vretimale_7809 [Volvox reticuliferus]
MVRRSYTTESQERFWFDILSAIVLFMTAIGGAWLPKYLCSHGTHVSSSKSLAFHLGNMLSAGVMLSAGFCHLLADAHRSLLFLGRFPISNFLAATGYIITLLADQVVQFVSEQQASMANKGDRSSAGAAGAGGGSAGGGGDPLSGPILRNGVYHKLPSGAELVSIVALDKVVTSQEGAITMAVQRESSLVTKAGAGAGADLELALVASVADANGHACGALANGRSHSGLTCGSGTGQGRGLNNGGKDDGDGASSSQPGLGRPLNRSQSTGGDCHSAGVVALLGGGGRRLSFATAVLLAAALCIHSVLEGMALGAQSSMRSTEDIMVAIAAHKGLAAYALGASIMESGASSERFWTVIGCFSLATPLGIFAGYGMSTRSANGTSGAALSALASGTFLYVAFMEVIPKELADGKHRLAKMAAFLLGYSLMSLLAVWA